MPRPARRGRARPLTRELFAQLLACGFSVSSDCEDVLSQLNRKLPHAIQRYPVSREHRFDARRSDGAFQLFMDGRPLQTVPDAPSAADAIYWRMYDTSLDAVADYTRVHGGCVTLRGRRTVIVGPERSGKSTLMTRLLYDGFAVHCDDIILIRAGAVLPYPRRLRVRPESLRLLPPLRAVARSLPVDRRCLAFDPSEHGFTWEIVEAPADIVLFLEPAFGGPARLEASSRHEMARRVMGQSNLPAGGRGPWIRDITALVDAAACYVLHSGKLDSIFGVIAPILGGSGAAAASDGSRTGP